MNQSQVCPFCSIVNGDDLDVREVMRTKTAVVFFPTNPAVLGHCLVIPRRHVEAFTDLRVDELQDVMGTAQLVAKKLDNVLHPEGINIIQSNGEAASQTVPHLHVHVVPRWYNDSVGEFWPLESNYSEQEKAQMLIKMRSVIDYNAGEFDSEDHRQHLIFIQDIISRMANSSASVKGWLLPVATAAYGYAFTQYSLPVAVLGIVATLIFMFLDVGYLYTERKYRNLYMRVANKESSVTQYSLDHREKDATRLRSVREYCRTIFGWSVGPFYLALVLVGLVAVALIISSGV